jgi:hypothetical protein
MPHEKIRSTDATRESDHNVRVAWDRPSSPGDTGPGHGNDDDRDGHVMVAVERPGSGMRMACSIEEIRRRLPDLIRLIRQHDTSATPDVLPSTLDAVIREYGEELSYAFGSPSELLAVMVDRKGCNRLIGALRRARDAAFGKDE